MAVVRRRKPVTKKTAKKAATRRKPAAKKTTARRKPAAKKTATKRTTVRKKTAARKKTVRRAVAKKPAAKKKTKAKRKPNPAFMRPWTLSEELGAVVGMKPIPRPEVVKKLWAYIKRNKLQDTVNRRMINADDKLKKVFDGKRKVSMFEMTKLVSRHLK
jgi:upstream activation factor subunit UAF30